MEKCKSPKRKRHAKILNHIAEDLTQEEICQAKLIVARQKFWTGDIEKLLRRWRRQVNLLYAEHKVAEKRYNIKYYLVGVPATITSAIVSSGILTTFKNCNECTSPVSNSCSSDESIRLAMGIIGIISVVFTCFSLFMNYGQASSDSKSSADDYSELTRKIDSLLKTPISARSDPISSLQEIRAKFDDISKKSPSVSSLSLEYKIIQEEKKRNSSPALVAAQQNKKKIPDASSLARILVEKIEEDGQKQVNFKKKLEEENNYDTEDESKEVAIAIDFEELRPEDLLEEENKQSVQASLARALEFELSRMYFPDRNTKNEAPVEMEPISVERKKSKNRKNDEVKNDDKEKEEL